MTDTQKRFIYVVLTILSGPAAAFLVRYFHLGGEEAKMITDLLSALSVAVGSAWGLTTLGASSVARDASMIPGVQVHVDTTRASAAPQAVQDLVSEKTVPDVVSMTGGPVKPKESS